MSDGVEISVYPEDNQITIWKNVSEALELKFNSREEMLDFPKRIQREFDNCYLSSTPVDYVWRLRWDPFQFYEGDSGSELFRYKQDAIIRAREILPDVLELRKVSLGNDEFIERTLIKITENYTEAGVRFYATFNKTETRGKEHLYSQEREQLYAIIEKMPIVDNQRS